MNAVLKTSMALPLIATLALAGCGGGGSGNKPDEMMQPPSQPERPNQEPVDTDGDGVGDNADAFPNDAAETMDSDGDGVGDNADAFPNDAAETMDSDGDGVGDNADAFPNDATRTTQNNNPVTDPVVSRPPQHQVRVVGSNELSVNHVSTSTRVVDGRLVRVASPPDGARWVTRTDYPVMEFAPRNHQEAFEQGHDAYFHWGYWSTNESEWFFGGNIIGIAERTDDVDGSTYLGNGRIARYGVFQKNGEIIPFSQAVKPLTSFADSPSFQGKTAHYAGFLIGITTESKQPMSSAVAMELELDEEITGTIEFDGLQTFERDGSFVEFLDGYLKYDIAIDDNTIVTTGGDAGTVTGIFGGIEHEVAVGTVQHKEFTGAFGVEND